MSADSADGVGTVLADLQVSRSLAIQWAVVGTMGFGASLGLFSALYQAATGRPATYDFAPAGAGWWTEPVNALAILALATVVVVPHEWLHGAAIRRYGGEPRYGVGVSHFVLPYAYATTDHRFTRGQFVVVALTPLVVLTLVGVPAMLALGWGWLALPLAANAGGAVGDLWMVLTLLGYPPHVYVEDHRTGFRVIGRADDRPRELSVTDAVWDALVGVAVAVVGLLVVLSFGGLFVLDALGVGSVTVGEPGTITFVLAYVNTPEEISISIGWGVQVVGALLGLSYSFVRTYQRQRRSAGARTGDR